MAEYGNMEKALPGLLYGLYHHIDSRVVAGGAQFGCAVFDVDGSEKGVAKKANSEPLLGIAARTALDSTKPLGNCTNVVRTGKVWGCVADSCSVGGTVYVGKDGFLYGASVDADVKHKFVSALSGTPVSGKDVVVKIGGETITYTTGSTTLATEGAALAAKIAGASAKYTASYADGSLTIEARLAGAGFNGDELVIDAGTSGITFGTATETAGAGATEASGWKFRSTLTAPGLALVDMD